MNALPHPSPESIAVILESVAAGGRRGTKIASILPMLVTEAKALGELAEYSAVRGGILRDAAGKRTGAWCEPVGGRGMRAEWFERLASAICSEAIDRYTAKQVVEILLRPK